MVGVLQIALMVGILQIPSITNKLRIIIRFDIAVDVAGLLV